VRYKADEMIGSVLEGTERMGLKVLRIWGPQQGIDLLIRQEKRFQC